MLLADHDESIRNFSIPFQTMLDFFQSRHKTIFDPYEVLHCVLFRQSFRYFANLSQTEESITAVLG